MKNHNKPHYPHAPIKSLDVLARILQLSQTELIQLCVTASTSYRHCPQTKKDGSIRDTWDAHNKLKSAHGRIQCMLLRKVAMPDYLHGSLRKRDASSNAEAHIKSRLLINEDIENFFPSIGIDIVYRIWTKIFRFSPQVAYALSFLCTKDGYVPQGAKTSSFLANLAFIDEEGDLVSHLEGRGYTYTRYVDDISVSTKRRTTQGEKSRITALIYRFFGKHGFSPKRKKHEISTQSGPMMVTGFLVNRKVSVPVGYRAQARAMIARIESDNLYGVDATSQYEKKFNRASGKIGVIERHHGKKGKRLRERLRVVSPAT